MFHFLSCFASLVVIASAFIAGGSNPGRFPNIQLRGFRPFTLKQFLCVLKNKFFGRGKNVSAAIFYWVLHSRYYWYCVFILFSFNISRISSSVKSKGTWYNLISIIIQFFYSISWVSFSHSWYSFGRARTFGWCLLHILFLQDRL